MNATHMQIWVKGMLQCQCCKHAECFADIEISRMTTPHCTVACQCTAEVVCSALEHIKAAMQQARLFIEHTCKLSSCFGVLADTMTAMHKLLYLFPPNTPPLDKVLGEEQQRACAPLAA